MPLRPSTARRTSWRGIRRAARRARNAALDWLLDHDPFELILLALGFLVVAATPILIIVATAGGPSEDDLADISPPGEEAPPNPVDVANLTNVAGGYAFSYPSTWVVSEAGTSTQLESPSGDIVVSFGLGTALGLEAESARLLESAAVPGDDLALIGTSRERIGGSPSFLASGTSTDETGRRVRFVAIAIRGEPRNYAISIVVSAGLDATRVLSRVERIVGSFEILGSTTTS
jgi:hypothetical protein